MNHQFAFTMTEATYLQANRLHFWFSARNGKFLWVFGWIISVYFALDVATNYIDEVPLREMDWLNYGGMVVFCILAILFCYGLGYWLLPRQTRKLFAQQKLLHSVQNVMVTEEAIIISSDLTTTKLPYAMAHKWLENSEMFLVYLTDRSFHFFPVRVVDSDAIDAIRANLIAAGCPGRAL